MLRYIHDTDNQKTIHDMIEDLTTMMTISLLSISAIWVSFILENISFLFFLTLSKIFRGHNYFFRCDQSLISNARNNYKMQPHENDDLKMLIKSSFFPRLTIEVTLH